RRDHPPRARGRRLHLRVARARQPADAGRSRRACATGAVRGGGGAAGMDLARGAAAPGVMDSDALDAHGADDVDPGTARFRVEAPLEIAALLATIVER